MASSSRQENGARNAPQTIVNGLAGSRGIRNNCGSYNGSNNDAGASKDTVSSTASTAVPPPSARWQPTSTHTNSTATTSNRRNQEIATRRRKQQAILDANKPMELILSNHFRKRIERLLLLELDNTSNEDNNDKEDSNYVDDTDDGGMENNDKNVDNEEEEMEEIDTHRRLVRDGFLSSDVLSAMRKIRIKRRRMTNKRSNTATKIGGESSSYYEEVLQYLCIQLNEDELPPGFDHRGGTLDVLHPKGMLRGGGGGGLDEEKSTTKTGAILQKEITTVDDETIGGEDNSEDNDGVLPRFAKRFGLTRQEVHAIRTYARSSKPATTEEEDDDTMKRAFWRVLIDAAPLDGAREMTMLLSDEDRQRNLDASSDELEAIESIFLGDGELTIERNGETTCVSIALPPFGSDKLYLEVYYSDGFYPDFPPKVFVVSAGGMDSCGGASYLCGGKVNLELVRQLSKMGRGREIVFELFGVASSLLQEEAESPSNASSSALLSYLRPTEGEVDNVEEIKEENNERTTLHNSLPSKQTDADSCSGGRQSQKRERPLKPTKRRPRDRDTFWNAPPVEIPPAVSLPISPALERERKSLPAAASRGEFLSLLARAVDSGGRVLLVTGETGCGKVSSHQEN